MTWLVVAVVGLAAAAFALRPQLAILSPPWALLALVVALAWAALLAPSRMALREVGPLEAGPAT